MTKQEILDYFKDINEVYNDCTRLDSLARMLNEVTASREWIPVSERLPKSMVNKVIVCLEHDDLVGYIGFGHYEKYKGVEMWYDLEHEKPFSKNGYRVTHWMPLPEPPKGGD